MKKLFVVVFTIACVLSAYSQQKSVDRKSERRETLIKKQILVNDLENQIKDISFSAVRVFARYKIASWLWKDGKDASARAEEIAVSALDDLYENKIEIPPVYFNALGPKLFTLLDLNAKDSVKKLKEKYKISDNESELFDSLLNQKDGEKLAADAAVRSLTNQSGANPEIFFLIWRLQQRRSPELFRLLSAILDAEETGRVKFTADLLTFMSGCFVEPTVPVMLQKRFLKVVVDRSRNAAQIPEGNEEGFFNLLSGVMQDVSTKFPELFPEASIIHSILKTKVSKESLETQEQNERIENSADRLSAMIAEAERTDNNTSKYDLYVSAAYLALKLKKFIYSANIFEKTVEIELPPGTISERVKKKLRDQFLGEITEKALQSGEPDSADYATKKIADPLAKAESLRKTANYYIDRNDLDASLYALNESIKYAAKVEPTSWSLPVLINLLPVAQRIDPSSVFELNKIVAKSINAIPTLNVEDKPQTENYKNYVTNVMIVNWNLLPVLTQMVKVDKNAVTDLAGRIDKKEIKIVANYVLLTDSIDQSIDPKKIGEKQLN